MKHDIGIRSPYLQKNSDGIGNHDLVTIGQFYLTSAQYLHRSQLQGSRNLKRCIGILHSVSITQRISEKRKKLL